MSGSINAMARECLRIWVSNEILAAKHILEGSPRTESKAEKDLDEAYERREYLEKKIFSFKASNSLELRAKAAVALVSCVENGEDSSFTIDLTCDLLGVRSVDELGDDAASVAMSILSRKLV